MRSSPKMAMTEGHKKEWKPLIITAVATGVRKTGRMVVRAGIGVDEGLRGDGS